MWALGGLCGCCQRPSSGGDAAAVSSSKEHPESLPRRLLRLPQRGYRHLTAGLRPDAIASKTRDREWALLQSQWRWLTALLAYLGPPSHVLAAIKWPLLFYMAIAAFAMWDAYSGSFRIFVSDGVTAAATMTWRLSTFMLALLLAFRVNRTYERWWLGRQAFAGVGNAALSLATMATVWVADPQLQDELVRWCKLWHFSIYQLLQREPLHPKVACLLSQDELAYYSKSRKGRNLVTMRLRQLTAKADLSTAQVLAMDAALTKGVADQGMCARIMFQAMPLALSLFTTGFIEIWLLVLPFTIVTDLSSPSERATRNPGFELLLYLLVCTLMLGVDEIATQLEQPFRYMPLLDIADTTLRDVSRVQEEAAVLEALGAARLQPSGAGDAAGKANAGGGGSEMTVLAVVPTAAQALPAGDAPCTPPQT